MIRRKETKNKIGKETNLEMRIRRKDNQRKKGVLYLLLSRDKEPTNAENFARIFSVEKPTEKCFFRTFEIVIFLGKEIR